MRCGRLFLGVAAATGACDVHGVESGEEPLRDRNDDDVEDPEVAMSTKKRS
jgi:hypothetical protein